MILTLFVFVSHNKYQKHDIFKLSGQFSFQIAHKKQNKKFFFQGNHK